LQNDTTLNYYIPTWRDFVHQNIVITPERLKNKNGWFELFEGWQYKIGDDTTWADTYLNDTDWKMINPQLEKEDFEKLKWTGNIWFRNHIFVDSSLWNKPFGLRFLNTGAAEIYLNGKLLYKFGVVGDSRETEEIYFDRTPKHLVFNGREEQVIAVRYSNHSAAEMVKNNIMAGFTFTIGDLDLFVSNRIQTVREISIQQLVFSFFILAFGIMHFLLFVFYPKSKENLFYSISMLSFAIVIFLGPENHFAHSMLTLIDLSIISSISVQMSILFGLLTVYASSYSKMPKQYIFFVLISAVFFIQTLIFPHFGGVITDYAYYIFAIILTLEIFRIVIRSIKRKEPWGWGWIVGVGFLVAMLFIAYQILIITSAITQPLFGIYLVYVYGIVFLAITVSINLSKKVSDTNKDLETQLIQVKELSQKTIDQERKAREEELTRKLLEVDNERKTRELEEARNLQLSMLPRNVPQVPGLDIAVYMKTATEVGGDYYDFKYNQNGALLIAVGDATGHGMKAGTMVATVKGLFTAESINSDIANFLTKSNSIIRNMQFGNLYMTMLVAKIEGEKVTISSAGMPPALIYRYNSKDVEEIKLKALPLGGTSDFEYSKTDTVLAKGDTLLLMSDGFPELFNKQKEILEYERAKEIFAAIAESSASDTIKLLQEEADHWRGEAMQEDDITFVVVKRK
jgi:serine phosphatase RsbU (regulator of sigma subunit)